MKGIILAAGKGTRLYPVSIPISKILLPVFNKPMVYYPLATLLSAGLKEILIVVNKDDCDNFKKLLGDGSQWGISIEYAVQPYQRGIADALLIGEKFIGDDSVILVLGDNLFYCDGLDTLLSRAIHENKGATIFCKEVADPRAFGVAEVGGRGEVISLEEKPKKPKSNLAVVGMYIYDNDVCNYAKELTPSARGELEVTDLNAIYLHKGKLNSVQMPSNCFWEDAGSFESLLKASNEISDLEAIQDILIGSPEYESYRRGNITREQLLDWISKFKSNNYYMLLKNIVT